MVIQTRSSSSSASTSRLTVPGAFLGTMTACRRSGCIGCLHMNNKRHQHPLIVTFPASLSNHNQQQHHLDLAIANNLLLVAAAPPQPLLPGSSLTDEEVAIFYGQDLTAASAVEEEEEEGVIDPWFLDPQNVFDAEAEARWLSYEI